MTRIVGALELPAPDLVEADGGDDKRVAPEGVVHLLIHSLRLDRRRIEVRLAPQRIAQMPHPLHPLIRLARRGKLLCHLPQRLECQPGIRDDSQVWREDPPNLERRDINMDKLPVAAID